MTPLPQLDRELALLQLELAHPGDPRHRLLDAARRRANRLAAGLGAAALVLVLYDLSLLFAVGRG